ncbi:hypothetical protein [Secundilactobacillus similis]|nr:hypothetical protein [Secundilactobacillus similis]
MSKLMLNKTKHGRRWFTKQIMWWTCGYIEIDSDMPRNYFDPVYDCFYFWMGPTFMGIAFPNLLNDGEIIMASQDFLLDSEADKPLVEQNILSLKPEFQDAARQAVEDGNYFWVVGFDDNHCETLGKTGMIAVTKRVAEQMDARLYQPLEDLS